MTAYERLMAEALPTGTFGHAHDTRPADGRWTEQEQARHLAELLAALNDRPPRLRLVTDRSEAA